MKGKLNRFDHLPSELIFLIVSYIDTKRYTELNKRTRSSIKSFTKHIRFSKGKDGFDEEKIIHIIRKNPAVQSINISNQPEISPQGFQILLNTCSVLRNLTCKFTRWSSVDALPPTLLNLSLTCDIVNDELRHLVSKESNLRVLSLCRCTKIDNEGLEYLARSVYMGSLTKLDLSHCAIADKGIMALCEADHLRELNLWNTKVTDKGLEALCEALFELECLILKECHHITDWGIEHVSRNMHWLRALDLMGCDITDASLQALSKGCPFLQWIELTKCASISDLGVRHLSDRCHYLQHLCLSFCENITDQSLHFISKGCPRLSFLDLSCCQQITDDGLYSLGRGCSMLKELKIIYCVHVTDAGIEKLIVGCPYLKFLDLFHCRRLTDATLTNISQHCQFLSKIDIRHCNNISALAVERFRASFPSLQIDYPKPDSHRSPNPTPIITN
eukprot:TRINITY_DN5037_c0_g1_i1.p1 TRINITY_DN5037_c0_g1~~TRINITY_DN5037_c0_g1_i1.p1  ORF type:complete len:461 (-),score=33.94 TRINITY_DN5037_c0_g1_i1:153-1490(-)